MSIGSVFQKKASKRRDRRDTFVNNSQNFLGLSRKFWKKRNFQLAIFHKVMFYTQEVSKSKEKTIGNSMSMFFLDCPKSQNPRSSNNSFFGSLQKIFKVFPQNNSHRMWQAMLQNPQIIFESQLGKISDYFLLIC